MSTKTKLPLLVGTMLTLALAARGQVVMNIDATQRGPETSPYQYGLFFEEINHAGDGGLYAELVRNRSFEDNTTTPEHWGTIAETGQSVTATLVNTSTTQLNDQQAQCLRVVTSGASMANKAGIYNEGFWGMHFQTDSTYTLTAWVRVPIAYSGRIFAQLQAADGTACSDETLLEGKVENNKWVKLTATVKATANAEKGRLAIMTSCNGTMYIDVVSLMPHTWKGRPNGLRTDLAELLYATKPTFLRFPGGCYVEGQGSWDATFQWKKTIGPIEKRPGHWNNNWGYRSSDGLGYDEYLQMCEDLGAAPMFVVTVGLGHGYTIPYEDVDTLVQNTLDAIEYANGDETTTYGAMRIANGHKDPYNLKFIEVGNENNQGGNEDYARRYIKFYNAIHEKYPDITIIGNVDAWGTDSPRWTFDYPVDLVDEHYYRSNSWMRSNYNKYDRYARTVGVYNGEYAANSSGTYGTYGNLNSALGEAVYMLGMEKNSDVCRLASFAPIFTHEENPTWAYDMIHFNAAKNFVTPSYHVQQMLGNNLGKQNLVWTETGNSVGAALTGKVGVGTWATQAEYDDLKVVDGATGSTLLTEDFSASSDKWNAGTGTWAVTDDGTLKQSAASDNCTYVNKEIISATSYKMTLRAKKTGGKEGFLVILNYKDSNNYCWWNIGGWDNTQHAVEQCVNGSKTTLAAAAGAITTGEWYDIEIDVNGATATCKLNGTVIHEFTIDSDKLMYQSAQLDEENGILYLKVVNPTATDGTLQLNLKNMQAASGSVQRLTSASGTDENSMDQPDNVKPSEWETLTDVKTLSVPAYSLNVFKLNVTDAAAEVNDGVTDGDEDKYGYLYAHMHASNQTTCFALSRYGLQYNDLFNSGEAFSTKAYTSTGGMRDAYVMRTESGKFILAGTDMNSALGWTSNHIMVLMKSNDLVHWDKTATIDLESDENMKALGLTDKDDMTAAWAPQVIYDPVTKLYVVYYSVGFPDRHRIYYTLIDEDLNIKSLPKVYFDPGYDIIDADIVYNKLDKQYVMVYKTESGAHHLKMATATTLVPEDGATGLCQWTLTPDSEFDVYESGKSIEAPSVFRPIGSRTWKLAYMNYSGGGYRMMDLDEHCKDPQNLTNIQGDVSAQHGSFLTLTEKEYKHLLSWENVTNLLTEAKKLNATQPLEALTAAIEQGEKAISESGTFEEETAAMAEAETALNKAIDGYADFLKQQAAEGKIADMTFLLTNPDFANGSTGWSGTTFTAASAGVAEQYSKTFDFYQQLTGLPNGKYRVEVQSFYRAGGKAAAYTAHLYGTETINAIFYANNEETPVQSLFDTDVYTYSPSYTYPDNVSTANTAFNTNDLYHNTLEVTVTDGTLKIGIRSAKSINADWCCFDNFKLTYLDAGATGIGQMTKDTKPDAATPAYSIDGKRLTAAPADGLYIQGGRTLQAGTIQAPIR